MWQISSLSAPSGDRTSRSTIAVVRLANLSLEVTRLNRSFATALIVLALLNAPTLERLSLDLPVNSVTSSIVTVAENWNALMDTTGLNTAGDFLHQQFQAARELKWSDFKGGGDR